MTPAFYTKMLEATRSLPERVLEEAYTCAVAEKDLTLAALVVSRKDAPTSVLTQARRSRNLQIRGAYYARSAGVDPELLDALRAERAQGAMGVAADATTTPAEVLAVLAEVGGPVVCTKVIAHQSAAPSVRREALVRLDLKASELTTNQAEELTALLHGSPQLVVGEGEEPLALTTPLVLTWALTTLVLPGRDLEALLRAAAASWGTLPDRQRVGHRFTGAAAALQEEVVSNGAPATLLVHLDLRVLSDQSRAKVCEEVSRSVLQPLALAGGLDATSAASWLVSSAPVLAADEHGRRALVDLATHESFDQVSTWQRRQIVNALVEAGLGGEMGEGGDTTTGRITRAAASEDPEELVSIVAEERGEDDRTLVAALLKNPHLPPEAVVALVEAHRVGYGEDEALLVRYATSVEVCAAVLASRQVQVALVAENPLRAEIARRVVERLQEQQAPVAGRWSRSRDHRVVQIEALVRAGYLDEDGWRAVDAFVGAHTAETVLSGAVEPLVAWRAGVLLGEALGDDPAAWEAYRVLAKGCTASFADLLSGAVAVTG